MTAQARGKSLVNLLPANETGKKWGSSGDSNEMDPVESKTSFALAARVLQV
jgi:hypothetical protein